MRPETILFKQKVISAMNIVVAVFGISNAFNSNAKCPYKNNKGSILSSKGESKVKNKLDKIILEDKEKSDVLETDSMLYKKDFENQSPKSMDCKKICIRMYNKAPGVKYVKGEEIQVATEHVQIDGGKKEIKMIVNSDSVEDSIKEIDSNIENKVPTIIGVNHKLGTTYNPDHTTDHFILIVGKGVDEQGPYYRYFDPATHRGASKKNKLRIDPEDKRLKGKPDYATKRTYDLTKVERHSQVGNAKNTQEATSPQFSDGLARIPNGNGAADNAIEN